MKCCQPVLDIKGSKLKNSRGKMVERFYVVLIVQGLQALVELVAHCFEIFRLEAQIVLVIFVALAELVPLQT